MFPTCISFPSSGDKENIHVSRSEKRRDALIDGQSASHPTATPRAQLTSRPNTTGTKSSRRPLLQRVISKSQSITILTNPARTGARSVPPTIHEEVTRSPLSTIYQQSSPSPVSPRASVCQPRSAPQITILEREKREAHPRSTPNPKSILLNASGIRSLPSDQSVYRSSPSPLRITILSDPEKEKREAHPRSPKSILIDPGRTGLLQSRPPPHITILSNPEREKREAHTFSLTSVRQSRSPPHITILSNPEREKREAHPRSTQRTKSIRNALAAAHALSRVPAISIMPIPPPQIPAPAPAPAADPNPDAVKENVKLKFVVSDIIVQETGQGVRDPETGTGADTTMTSSGEMLVVPLVDWRGRLDEDELSRYYPKEHAKAQFAHRLRSMVRSESRSAAARRRDHARRGRQTATTATATTTPPSIALIVSHTPPI
jgi:hypothetical protein